jgi:hypothetical protein
MKSAFLPLLLALACVPSFSAEKTRSNVDRMKVAAPSMPAADPNSLSAAEREAGWRLLFDGHSLTGWRSFRTDKPGAAWSVQDGALVNAGKTGDLMTTSLHSDFELSFDWKISEGGNSGVIYRIGLGEAATYRTGPEYQVLDNQKAADNQQPNHRAGSLYDLDAAARDVTKPVGQWNTGRIIVRGWHIEHWLNGEKLLELDLATPAGKGAIARSMFKDSPRFATFPRGFIALQDFGDAVSFRNIKIREL